MSKKFLKICLVLIVLLSLYSMQKIIPYVVFNIGKNDYNKQQYPQAYKMLKLAVALKNQNKEYRYYFVETMLHLRPTLIIQKELSAIAQANLADSADLIADMQIAKWRNQIVSGIGENYIEQTTFDNKVLRWDASKFPLKVYIKNDSKLAPDYYEAEIKRAFLQWQASTGNFINFQFINNQGGNEKDANIVVHIVPATDMKKCDQKDCKYTVAYTTPTINGNLLKKFDMLFYDSNNLGKPFDKEDLYCVALHEIGHSLGIMGHSYNKDNVMYMEANQSNTFEIPRSDFQFISPIDLNTLSLLYKLIPDITNTPLSEFDVSNQFFAPIVIGDNEQINSRKMSEAQNYINIAPDLSNGYIDLADAYLETRQYNKALEALDKALSRCVNDNEKFIVYYNFASIYMAIKDWDNALKYANMAKSFNDSSDIDGLIAAINYNLGNKELAKKSYMTAVQKTPDNIIDSYNLAMIYVRELNFAQAGKILNHLIEVNPEAKTDPKIKMHGLLIFLFK